MAAYNEIADFAHYNGLMGRSLIDKLFFVDKVNPDIIVDFGSADGLLIDRLQEFYPDAQLFGYDNNPTMNELANARPKRHGNRQVVMFCEQWGLIEDVVKHNPNKKSALILSSVIHEIYTYLETKQIDTFWDRVFKTGFDYIIIRDMIPSRSIERASDINDIAKVYRKYLKTSELKDFENNFGSIETNRNLVHFLLKYRYTEPNWAREVKENYFPLYREDLLAMLPIEYNIKYHDHFALPFLRQHIYDTFRIDLKDNTHLKMILQRE
jgi:hypothetical protein